MKPRPDGRRGPSPFLLAPLVFYAAVLVVGAWPRQLQPGTLLAEPQLEASRILAHLGWPAGLGVFSGQADLDTATRMSCFRITGEKPGTEPVVLYDTFPRCFDGQVDVFKDNLRTFEQRMLALTLPRMRGGGVRDVNAHPENILFSIADYHCRRLDPARPPGSRVVFGAIYVRSHMVTGEGIVTRVREGAHHCAEGTWESF